MACRVGIAATASRYNPEATMGSSRNWQKLHDFTIEFPVIPEGIHSHFWIVSESDVLPQRPVAF